VIDPEAGSRARVALVGRKRKGHKGDGHPRVREEGEIPPKIGVRGNNYGEVKLRHAKYCERILPSSSLDLGVKKGRTRTGKKEEHNMKYNWEKTKGRRGEKGVRGVNGVANGQRPYLIHRDRLLLTRERLEREKEFNVKRGGTRREDR